VIEIRRYLSPDGKDIYGEWLAKLKDPVARARIAIRIDRLAQGNFGDSRALRDGLHELRIDWGPGYRVYFANMGEKVVLLLGGGDKRKQSSDIERALQNLRDYKAREPFS
jgi:putative addiction module killer protein